MRRLCATRVACALATWASVPGCSANEDVPAPLISSVVPDHAAPGAIVALAGSYFCQRPDNGQEDPTCDAAGTVYFATLPGISTSWADNAIMVEVPSGTGAVDVSVIAAGRVSNSIPFTIE